MIDLRLKVDPLPIVEPIIVRLTEQPAKSDHDALLVSRGHGHCQYDYNGFALKVYVNDSDELDGDILLMFPGNSTAHRLLRANSLHNTLLITEQCDQLCVMCSQPPKKHHLDLFDHFETAAKLAPENAYLGLSGGEPLLHKARLWTFLRNTAHKRPDLKFHILTNGQHFEETDIEFLNEIGRDRILWGIPLYSNHPALHDEIVGKASAFQNLQRNLALLAESASSIEIRTVVMKQNWEGLPDLSQYITTRLPFIERWALMQLENIGYGRMNWGASFKDTSIDSKSLERSINLASAKGLDVSLFNFPLCTLPPEYQRFAYASISDWKRKYLPLCNTCNKRVDCGGFFEWYNTETGFKEMGAL